MHLLPVDEQIRDELLFDYVLVVDTEGLRSTVTDPDVVVKKQIYVQEKTHSVVYPSIHQELALKTTKGKY